MSDLLAMFLTFFKIGAFTFGGGYAMLPLIREEVVEVKYWVADDEFLDAIAVAQSLPGPVAVNTAVLVGYKLRKLPGALATTLGVVLPSVFVILAVAASFSAIKGNPIMEQIFSGIRPAVVSLIFIAALQLLKSLEKNTFNICVMFSSFVAIVFFKLSPIPVVFMAALAGFIKVRWGGLVRDHS